MNGVFGEKLPKFVTELRRQCFIVGYYKGRLLNFFNHIGNGESFSRTGNAQKRLVSHSFFQATHKLPNRIRLISGRFMFAN